MKNNFNLTLVVTIAISVVVAIIMPFSIIGLLFGILYAQVIEWFVHGWIQHHPFKIFKPYRDQHSYHHKHPSEPRSVQPFGYFIVGTVLLLLPFYWLDGFALGYLIMYALINIIHYDLHTENKILPDWVWSTSYFELIMSHHSAHHAGRKLGYTTHSVTNPFIDMVFSKIKLTSFNNWIAKNLKI